MYLPTDDDVDLMCEWYRASNGREPVWVSGDLTLDAGFRLTIYYMQRPDLHLDMVARDLGVMRRKLDLAINDLTSVVEILSSYGRRYGAAMTPDRLKSSSRGADKRLAQAIEREPVGPPVRVCAGSRLESVTGRRARSQARESRGAT